MKDYLDELKAQGSPVPEPTPVREVMTDPANRQPHRIFDLGDFLTWAQLDVAKRALDEQDALEARRFITFFGEDDQLAGEIDFDPPPGLTRLHEIFGYWPNDLLLIGCYPIGEREACLLKPYLKDHLQLDRYAYFLEVHDRNE